MMRKDEAEQVVTAFREEHGIQLVQVNAADRFLDRLAGVDDPETKRKIIERYGDSDVVRLLTAGYRDRPGYRAEWSL